MTFIPARHDCNWCNSTTQVPWEELSADYGWVSMQEAKNTKHVCGRCWKAWMARNPLFAPTPATDAQQSSLDPYSGRSCRTVPTRLEEAKVAQPCQFKWEQGAVDPSGWPLCGACGGTVVSHNGMGACMRVTNVTPIE